MTRHEPVNLNVRQLQQHSEEKSARLPSTFVEVVARVKTFALGEFDREVVLHQLYYHTREHINGVQRRANLIFQVISPGWEASLEGNATPDYISRMQLLLDLCAAAHDMVQIFIPHQPHTSRRREAGVSETLTTQKLLDYIKGLNQHLREHGIDESALFTNADLSIIQEAIEATICVYDPAEQAIYQPSLYDSSKQLSPVARILALADIGTLGMEGVAAYNQEGSLLFLEENPDVIPIILNPGVEALAAEDPELHENIRQRLLKRARFQVNFAKSRLIRFPREIASFSAEAIPVLEREVFRYLSRETIQKIESTTPIGEDTPLEVLIEFFGIRG